MIEFKMIHDGWKEWENMPKDLKNKFTLFNKKGWAGKYQYIYFSPKGLISLVYLQTGINKWFWEILELSNNNLFEDTERFKLKKDAKIKIKEFLE